MRRRDFLKWSAAGSLALMGLPGCGMPKTRAEDYLPGRNDSPKPPASPVISAGTPAMAVAHGTDASELIERGLRAMGGVERFVKRGQTVVIKPNFSVPRTPEQAATTNPELVAELVKRFVAAGAAEVKIIDYPFTNSQMCLENSGIRRFGEAAGARVFTINRLTNQFFTPVEVGGSVLKSAQYSRDVLEADVFVSFPILKHHNGTGLTMGMKNMMGLVWDRGFFHRTDLHRTIAECAAFKKPHLVVMDAIRGITDQGPMGPGPIKDYNQVVFSVDPVAADAYGAELFGMRTADIPYIGIAAELGAGTADWKRLIPVRA